MREIITQAQASRLLGISRQRVAQLIDKGTLTHVPGTTGDVFLSEVLARKANPPKRGVKGYILHIDMSSDLEMYEAYRSTGTALEVLRLHYETIKGAVLKAHVDIVEPEGERTNE